MVEHSLGKGEVTRSIRVMGTKRIAVWVVVGCCKTSRRWIEGFAFFIHFICCSIFTLTLLLLFITLELESILKMLSFVLGLMSIAVSLRLVLFVKS